MSLLLASCSFVIAATCWLGWQLLRQNGRILLRLDELEKRLDDLEFGEPDDPKSLSDNETSDQMNALPLPQGEGENQDRISRFGNRSVTRSRIKRDGLKAGTAAPSFRLPRLDGGELSLEELRGTRVLLVFSDPHCGPCNALAPELEMFYRENGTKTRSPSPRLRGRSRFGAVKARPSPPGEGELLTGTEIVMLSRGEPKENRAKVKEHKLTFPVVLQQQWEISRRYAMFATPMAYLIDETGVIAHDVAVGVEPIFALMTMAKDSQREQAGGVAVTR